MSALDKWPTLGAGNAPNNDYDSTSSQSDFYTPLSSVWSGVRGLDVNKSTSATAKTQSQNKSVRPLLQTSTVARPTPKLGQDYQTANGTSADESRAANSDIALLIEQINLLRAMLREDQKQRQEESRQLRKAYQTMYNDVAALSARDRADVSDVHAKLKSLASDYKDSNGELFIVRKRIEKAIEIVLSLYSKFEVTDRSGCSQGSASLKAEALHRAASSRVPAPTKTTSTNNMSQLQPQNNNEADPYWSCQIIFVLSADLPNVTEIDSVAYLKVQSRRPRQHVHFSDASALSFSLGIEASFPSLLKNRAWMPLSSRKLTGDGQRTFQLHKLEPRDSKPERWTKGFLDRECVTKDSTGNSHIYICLKHENFTWSELNQPVSTSQTAGTTARNSIDDLGYKAGAASSAPSSVATKVDDTEAKPTAWPMAPPGRGTRGRPPAAASSTANMVSSDSAASIPTHRGSSRSQHSRVVSHSNSRTPTPETLDTSVCESQRTSYDDVAKRSFAYDVYSNFKFPAPDVERPRREPWPAASADNAATVLRPTLTDDVYKSLPQIPTSPFMRERRSASRNAGGYLPYERSRQNSNEKAGQRLSASSGTKSWKLSLRSRFSAWKKKRRW